MRESLTRGLTQLGLSPDAVPQLEAYAAALLEKNRVMNLTAITAPQDVATLHLLDCAARLTMAVHARAEEYAAGHRQQYDIAASRAVANLNVLCELALPLVKVGGQFLAMKSVSSDDEIAGARGAIGQLGGRIADIRDYTVPETEVRHRLVIVEKVKDTPAIYPRSFARIKKAPLK